MAETLLAVVLTLVGAAILVLLGLLFWRLTAAAKELTVAVRGLSGDLSGVKGLSEIAAQFKDQAVALALVPKLLEGLTHIGKVQAEQVVKLERSVGELRASLGGGGPRGHDVQEADREYDIQQIMRSEGLSREQAESKYLEQTVFSQGRWT